jgi:hypothetical protein
MRVIAMFSSPCATEALTARGSVFSHEFNWLERLSKLATSYDKKWKLAFSDGNKRRLVTIAAGDLVTLGEAVAKAKARFGMPGGVPLVSCYEAGRDGFWLHRY